MELTVKLYMDPYLSSTVKYRGPYARTPIATIEGVKNGNFSNLNLFVDNTVELGILTDGEGYDVALHCNVIEVSWEPPSDSPIYYPFRVIGFITDWEYINDGNCRLSYVVDAFTSARSSDSIISMWGLCERTNLDYTSDQSLINLLSEPFSVSDTVRAESGATVNLNEAVYNFEGIEPLEDPFSGGDKAFIVTVSSAVIKYLNLLGITTTAFSSPPLSFRQGLQTISNLEFLGNDSTAHSGGVYRGWPLKFATELEASLFCVQILGGCGFRTILPPNGYDPIDSKGRMQMGTPEHVGGGNIQMGGSTYDASSNTEIETIRFITSQDLYNMYVIPARFATLRRALFVSYSNVIHLSHDRHTIHGLGGEPRRNAKILTYPYYYGKAVTANGDSVMLNPQVYNVRNNVWDNNTMLILDMKYVGGDKPCLMGRFKPEFSTSDPFDKATVGEWFTIRNYPAITLSINNSFNPQIQKEISQNRQLSALRSTSISSAQLGSPIKQSYRDGVQGQAFQKNDNAGSLANLMGRAGHLLGSIDRINPLASNEGFFSNTIEQDVQNKSAEANAGNVISPDAGFIEGNDYLGQLTTQAFSYYTCGASNAEAFSICRYWDTYGQSCNCIIEALNNIGDIWAGLAYVTTVDGKTFYKYSYIDVTGAIPNEWRLKIKELFESGVYLRDS